MLNNNHQHHHIIEMLIMYSLYMYIYHKHDGFAIFFWHLRSNAIISSVLFRLSNELNANLSIISNE